MRGRRTGISILELLVVLACLGLVMGAAWTLFGQGVLTSRRVAGTLDAQHELRSCFQAMVHELQGARRLFYPTPGARSQPGVGFVDREGRPIMIFTEDEGGVKVLYRADMKDKVKKELTRGVGTFRVTVPPPPPGEPPRTVNLAFGMEIAEPEPEEGAEAAPRSLRMVTSVTLRAMDEVYPE